MITKLVAGLVSALALGTSLAAQTAWIVDDDGGAGVDAVEIAAGLALANSGDLLIVRDGTYAGFTLDGLAVDVVADGEVLVEGQVSVRNLGAAQTVVLRGFDVDGSPAGVFGTGMLLEDCAGLVFVEDVSILDAQLAFSIDLCNAVSLTRCIGVGTSSTLAAQPGHGLDASTSTVTTYFCDFRGGTGPSAQCDPDVPGGDGGFAARLVSCVYLDHGSLMEGGAGGDACENISMGCSPAGDGGSGLVLEDISAAFELGGGAWLGGAGGNDAFPNCGLGQEGNPFDAGPELVFLAGETRDFEASSPVHVGETTELLLSGSNGDQVLLAIGFLEADAALLLNFKGFLLPTQIVKVAPAGTITAGPLSLPLVAPPIPGFDFVNVAVQPLYIGAPSDKVLGSASVITILP